MKDPNRYKNITDPNGNPTEFTFEPLNDSEIQILSERLAGDQDSKMIGEIYMSTARLREQVDVEEVVRSMRSKYIDG